MKYTTNYSTKKRSQQELNSEKRSVTFWLSMLFVLGFFVVAPFQKALFNGLTTDFEKPIFSSLLFSCATLLVLSIYSFYNWKLKSLKELLLIGVWLIPLTYLISSINSASHYNSMNIFYLQFIFITFFILGTLFAKNATGNTLILYSILFSGYMITVFGYMNWFGDATLFGIFHWSDVGKVYKDAVMGEPTAPRLASVFQYPNTYASLLIALMFSSIVMIIKSRKWYGIVIHSLMLVPIILALLLTLSRGAFVILPIIFLLILPFLSLYKQIISIIYLSISVLASLLILNPITTIGVKILTQYSGSDALKGWMILGLTSIIIAAIITTLQHFVASKIEETFVKKIKIKGSRIILPILVILVGTIGSIFILSGFNKFLPDNVRARFENINFQQHEVLERITFYKDSIKVIKDYPILGAGGGAWASIYEKYQNNPYTSRQAHNFLLQYLVEVGIVGGLILLGLLAIIFYLYIKNYYNKESAEIQSHLIYYIFVITLLIHSLLDFDMSFVFIQATLFLCLGGMLAAVDFSKNEINFRPNLAKIAKIAYPSVLAVISLIMIIISIQLISGSNNFQDSKKLLTEKRSLQEILKPLNTALEYRAYQPEYSTFKVQLLNSAYQQTKKEEFYNQAIAIVNDIKKVEPYNKMFFELEFAMKIDKNQHVDAFNLSLDALNKYPWDITVYNRLISLGYQLGNQEQQNKVSSTNKYLDKVLSVYGEMKSKIGYLATLPKGQNQGREFNILPDTSLSVGQILFNRGKYSEAAEALQLKPTDALDNATNRNIASLYLASLVKQGKTDQTLYDQLISIDQTQKQQIDTLVNSQPVK